MKAALEPSAARRLSLSFLPLQDRSMNSNASVPLWQSIAILVGRLIFAAVFIMAAGFKFAGMDATAGYIAAAGFPFALPLAWVAAIFESVLVICLLTGAFFSEAALLAAAYVLFLAFAFHGPAHWTGNQAEFGFFVDHFTFIAGLLFAAVKGPGRMLALPQTILARS
jgi:putative oxidoreductase